MKNEKSLAEAHMTKTENRDPHDTYNKLTMEGLIRNGDDAFDFGSYFTAATGKTVEGETCDPESSIFHFRI